MDDEDEEEVEEAREAASLPVAYSDDGAAMQVAGDDGSTLALKSGAISMEQVSDAYAQKQEPSADAFCRCSGAQTGDGQCTARRPGCRMREHETTRDS
jgi:hypothetical protein